MAAVALVLAGCSQETPGNASPGGNGDGTGLPTIPTEDTSEPAEPTETGGGDSGTGDLQPCELLTSAEQSQLQLAAGTEDDIGGQRTCLFTASGSHTVSIGVADELGLADVQSSGPATPTTIGSHDAVQFTGGVSSCAFALGVTDTSRVDVISAANGDEARACGIAKQAAELVEPKLP
ncbi:MAG: DUF3558 family protein [Actinophytocola sp.]